MQLSDFDFELPEELIAQRPADRRDASRLMVLRRDGSPLEHHTFAQLPELLKSGDLLVVNDARVIPARLLGQKVGTGGKAELLLVRPAANALAADALSKAPSAVEWLCLGQASKGFKPGVRIAFGEALTAEVLESLGGGEYRVRFEGPEHSLSEAIARAGRLPLPPYISRAPEAADAERYQTVFARKEGSVAAPTAGLHFTEEIFAKLRERGINRVEVTLDVGPGTFLPVRDGDLSAHKMHLERYSVPQPTADAVNLAKREGRRVVAVGTTVVRTLEAATGEDGALRAGGGETQLFITPGFSFRQVDALITNFHLPKSTLLMLVSAFVGRERMLSAYAAAVAARYRFFSYGDAMLLL